jgi:hypothetical protein
MYICTPFYGNRLEKGTNNFLRIISLGVITVNNLNNKKIQIKFRNV